MGFFDRVDRHMQTKSTTPGKLLPPWRRGFPEFTDWDGKKAIREGHKLSTVVYACNKLRSECLASLPWYVETIAADGEWGRAAGHPLETLLEYPNEFQSRQTIFQTIALQLDLVGNALMTKIMVTDLRSGGKVPSELWLIDPTNVRPIPNTNGISAYRYYDGQQQDIPGEGVIHFQFPDPATPYWGCAPLRSASRSVDTSTEAVRWNMNSLQNRAMPELMFTTEERLDQDTYETLMDRISQAYSSPDNARLPVVTGAGLTAEVINWKPIEMDFVNSLHFYREDVCMVYGVPLPMIQVMRDATLANVAGMEVGFWRNTMIPFADLVKATLNRGLIPREQRGEVRICYDLAGVKVLQEDRTAQVTNYATLVQNGQPPNAAAKYVGMDVEDVLGGDEAYIAGTLVPLKDAADLANEPAPAPVVKPRAA